MGFFNKIKEAVAGTDAGAITEGRLGRGVIVGAQVTGSSLTIGNIEQHICLFTVEVALDDTARYQATCRQRLPVWQMAQIQPGVTAVAVRVDARDPQRIAIDWDTPAPTVRLPQSSGSGSAAEVLAHGTPCRVIVQQFQQMGMTNAAGVPVYAFSLTVIPANGNPYQIQVGNPVPNEAIVHLYPGSQLPAKVLPNEPQGVVIDWAAAAAAV